MAGNTAAEFTDPVRGFKSSVLAAQMKLGLGGLGTGTLLRFLFMLFMCMLFSY
jgi:hypothetical protein